MVLEPGKVGGEVGGLLKNHGASGCFETFFGAGWLGFGRWSPCWVSGRSEGAENVNFGAEGGPTPGYSFASSMKLRR